MTLEIHIAEHLLTTFEIEEEELPGWENAEERIFQREQSLLMFFKIKQHLLYNLKNAIYYLTFKSKVYESPVEE